MLFDHQNRMKIGLILFVICSILSALQFARETNLLSSKTPGIDAITLLVKDLAQIKTIATDSDTLGYRDTSGDIFANRETIRKYYLAQYALIPTLVSRDTTHATRVILVSNQVESISFPLSSEQILLNLSSGFQLMKKSKSW